MSNFTQALAESARSATCQLLGVPQYLNDMVTRLSGGTFTPPISQIPNLWRRALCDTDAPPPSPPPFLGGQCPAFYSVVGDFTYRRKSDGALFQAGPVGVGNYLGPVSGAVRSVGQQLTLFIRDGNGVETSTIGVNNVDFEYVSGAIASVTRTDGQPDNCGNPNPEYDPPTPEQVEIPRDVTYDNNAGIAVTIPVVFVFARAQVDVNANVTIPFTLNLTPTLNITGVINVDGSVNFNFGGGTATTGAKDPRKGDCGDIPSTDVDPPIDPTDSDQPEQPDREREEVIKGVLVTVTALSNERASLIIQSDNPDIYAPSLGHVQFLCRVGNTEAAWTSDQPVKNRRNLIPCPWLDGAIAVRGTPQPGVTWNLTPIRGYAGIPVEYITA